MSTELVHVPVPGTDAPLQAVQIDARPFVALRPISSPLPVSPSVAKVIALSASGGCSTS